MSSRSLSFFVKLLRTALQLSIQHIFDMSSLVCTKVDMFKAENLKLIIKIKKTCSKALIFAPSNNSSTFFSSPFKEAIWRPLIPNYFCFFCFVLFFFEKKELKLLPKKKFQNITQKEKKRKKEKEKKRKEKKKSLFSSKIRTCLVDVKGFVRGNITLFFFYFQTFTKFNFLFSLELVL